VLTHVVAGSRSSQFEGADQSRPFATKGDQGRGTKEFFHERGSPAQKLDGLETGDIMAKTLARDLRKKYGYDKSQIGGPETGKKKGTPVDLLAEMQQILDRDVRGLAPEIGSSSTGASGSRTNSRVTSTSTLSNLGLPSRQSVGLLPIKQPGSKAVYPFPDN
jgi:hypothetical protein